MKKRQLIIATAALLAVAVFVMAREAASWRPRVVGQIRTLNPTSQVLQFSSDGRFLLTQSEVNNEPSLLWDAANWRQIRQLPPGKLFASDDFRVLAQIKDGRKVDSLLQLEFRPIARLFDLRNGQFLRQLRAPDSLDYNWTSDAQFTPDGQRLWLATRRFFYQFDTSSGRLLRRIKPFSQAQFSALSPDTGQILRDFDGLTWICQTDTGQPIRSLPRSAQARAGWSPNGAICWQLLPYKQGFRLWHARTGVFIRDWPTAEQTLRFTPNSKNIVMTTPSGLEMRDVFTGKLKRSLRGPRTEPFAIASDGSFALSLDRKGTLWKWRLK